MSTSFNPSGSYRIDCRSSLFQTDQRGSVYHLRDLDGHVISELNSSGGWNRGEIYAGGRYVATYVSSTTHFDHTDWLGTERARTDVAGALYETCQGLPFGDGLECSGADVSPLHFTGKQRDTESGLDYFGARYYTSALGRFTSPDKPFVDQFASHPQSWNLYVYARNNPLAFLDQSGLDCVDATGRATKQLTESDCTKHGNKWYRTVSTPTVVVNGSDVTDNDRMAALILGMRMAKPGVNLAYQGLRAFGYVADAPMMFAVECAAGSSSCTKTNAALALVPPLDGELGPLTRGARRILGGILPLADESVADAIRIRGGGGAQVNRVATWLRGKTVGEIANLAAQGNAEAKTAIKIIKEAARLSQK